MADLTDADKRVLFGDNYIETQREHADPQNPAATLLRNQEQAEKMDDWLTWAIVFGIVSGLIFLTNYFGAAKNFNPRLEIGAATVFILAVVFGYYSRRKKREILARSK